MRPIICEVCQAVQKQWTDLLSAKPGSPQETRITKLEAQRDALLEALKAVKQLCPLPDNGEYSGSAIDDMIDAAIAAAEGRD